MFLVCQSHPDPAQLKSQEIRSHQQIKGVFWLNRDPFELSRLIRLGRLACKRFAISSALLQKAFQDSILAFDMAFVYVFLAYVYFVWKSQCPFLFLPAALTSFRSSWMSGFRYLFVLTAASRFIGHTASKASLMLACKFSARLTSIDI